MSYSGCGLPYYIGTEIEAREQLVPRNGPFFKQKYNVDVFTGHRVLDIEPQAKTLTVENLATSRRFESYDNWSSPPGRRPCACRWKAAIKPMCFTCAMYGEC